MLRQNPEIGGYFELETGSDLPGPDAPHLGNRLTRLNSGRNALRAILATQNLRRLHLPEYLCDSMIQTVSNSGVKPIFYRLNESLNPDREIRCGENELWLGVNYFGLMDVEMAEAAQQTTGFVTDNCQAFYAKPLGNAISLYSPRKFFGVPDGGYLVGATTKSWPADNSQDRLEHLLTRAEYGPRAGYAAYQAHELMIGDWSVRQMSSFTRNLLATIDYAAAAKRRRENYRLLNEELGAENDLAVAVNFQGDGVPLVYPFLNTTPDLRTELHRHDIFAATYWPDCLQRSECGSAARHLALNLTALPIDQRYDAEDMSRVARLVQGHLAGDRARMVIP